MSCQRVWSSGLLEESGSTFSSVRRDAGVPTTIKLLREPSRRLNTTHPGLCILEEKLRKHDQRNKSEEMKE